MSLQADFLVFDPDTGDIAVYTAQDRAEVAKCVSWADPWVDGHTAEDADLPTDRPRY
jgi:hypothetical protein